ncbi:OsmC family protein [Megalodesulfovibrio paquesii]
MIRATSLPQHYATRFSNGQQEGIADTTQDKGGGNAGFRPHDLLEAAVASCMNMTLRMAAEKLAIAMTEVTVMVSLQRGAPAGPTFEYTVVFADTIPEHAKERLLEALEHCPVRTTLSMPLHFHRKEADAPC